MYMKCVICGKEMKNIMGGNYVCDSCGLAINDLVYRGQTATPGIIPNPPTSCDDTAHFSNCTINPIVGDSPNYSFWQQGWVCPKCGAVLSPSTSYCPFCAPKKNSTVTSDRVSYDTDNAQYKSNIGTDLSRCINPKLNKLSSSK